MREVCFTATGEPRIACVPSLRKLSVLCPVFSVRCESIKPPLNACWIEVHAIQRIFCRSMPACSSPLTILPYGKKAVMAFFAAAGMLAGQTYQISTFAGGVPPLTPSRALEASIGSPQAVVVDAAGNLYFNAVNAIFRLDAGGTLTRVAGNSRRGFSGDGGFATQAQLSLIGPYADDVLDYSYAAGLAISPAGDLYIADNGNSRIRKISQGIINTVAGGGVCRLQCNGRPATDLDLVASEALAFDTAGNLYILAPGPVVYKVSPAGIVTSADSHSDGIGVDSSAMAVDAAGNIYLAQPWKPAVIRKSPDGTITTVAGTGVPGHSGDGGPAASAQLLCPLSLFIDSSGNLYIGDGSVDSDGAWIRRVSPDGIITTVAGAPHNQNIGGPYSRFSPWGIASDSNGNLLVADSPDNQILSLSLSGPAPGGFTALAGNGTYSYAGDGGLARQAMFASPLAPAFDRFRNLYVSDYGNYRVRKITPGGIVTTIAGTGVSGYTGDGGPAISAQVGSINALAIDAAGSLYLADIGSATVRKIARDGTISTLAGTGVQGYSGDGGPAAAAQLSTPQALAVDGAGNVLIADGARLRRVTPDGVIATIAGNGTFASIADGSAAANSSFTATALAIDAGGDIYAWADSRIFKITPDGILHAITLSAQVTSQRPTQTPIPVANASLGSADGLAFDSAGNLFIADGGMVFRLGTDGFIQQIAGVAPSYTSWFGTLFDYSGDGGPASLAQLSAFGIALDAGGNVYVADSINNAVRLLISNPAGRRKLPR